MVAKFCPHNRFPSHITAFTFSASLLHGGDLLSRAGGAQNCESEIAASSLIANGKICSAIRGSGKLAKECSAKLLLR